MFPNYNNFGSQQFGGQGMGYNGVVPPSMQGDPFSGHMKIAPPWQAYGSSPNERANFDCRETAPLKANAPRAPGMRRRINGVAVLLMVLVPCALFALVLFSMSLHYKTPNRCYFLVGLAFLAVLGSGLMAVFSMKQRYVVSAVREPNWVIFFFICMALAWVLAYSMGEYNFAHNMRPFNDLRNLNNFTNVNPSRIRGQMMMDAGYVTFVPGTRLDIGRSMGFKSDSTYCVAPIVFGSEQMPYYDFWAVGTDCCSGTAADFHCNNFNNPYADGGLRLVGGDSDEQRPFYRLAVQQAEAAHGIQAVHPLFFRWVQDPVAVTESYHTDGARFIAFGLLAHLMLQLFLVAIATIAFSKMGYYGA